MFIHSKFNITICTSFLANHLPDFRDALQEREREREREREMIIALGKKNWIKNLGFNIHLSMQMLLFLIRSSLSVIFL